MGAKRSAPRLASAVACLAVFSALGGSCAVISSCERAAPPPSPVSEPPGLPPGVELPPRPTDPPEVRSAILLFQLPTRNEALRQGAPEQFYMFVDRYTNGTAQQVWQGGQYGFVRDIRMLRNGSTVFSRFHEGIDIMPVSRDAKNEPLDSVHSMADGIVVHANSSSRASNYGCYVVVEHATNSGPFFSLYAHLRSVDVTPGQRVLCGDLLGSMGYTGTGIDRRRAHVHVELNMLLSSRFSQWHAKGAYTSPNSQGSFNGQNMVGVDVAGWLQRHWVDARIKLSSFIQESETHWKIVVPNQGAELEIVQRYPWLRKPGAESAAWEISFAASAVPLSVRPVAESVTGVRVAWVKEFAGDHRWVTREMLSGTGSSAKLTKHGAEYVDLVVGQF